MTYEEWFIKQGELHANVMKKLENKTKNEVIEYFKFENMIKNEPNFCPLYKENKKCHDMDDLNCYFCACPHFRFDDNGFEKRADGKVLYSVCSINSKKGTQFIGEDYIHQNCSECLVPHKVKYIEKKFNRKWFEAMKEVKIV